MDDNVFVLSDQASVANHFLSELRDKTIQKDRMRFRQNMERLGEIMAYEISKKMSFESRRVETPLGRSSLQLLNEPPVLITILRAGVPFHQGFLNMFDHADCGFIGAYREEGKNDVAVTMEYMSIPSIDERAVILIDPMLATGRSVVDAHRRLLNNGTPAHLYIVSVVAAPEGIRLLKDNIAAPYSLWTCAVDEKLNSSFYIVPGLGDAGDLSYGAKL